MSRKYICRAFVVAVMVSFIFSGCGKKAETDTSSTGSEKTAVTANKTGPGDKGNTITEARLGAPLYPGATLRTSTKTDLAATGGEGVVEIYQLTTSDDWEKVVEFYKSHLKNAKTEFNQGPGSRRTATFSVGGGKSDIAVNVTPDSTSGTSIQVSKESR